jgi:hypothetical protein
VTTNLKKKGATTHSRKVSTIAQTVTRRVDHDGSSWENEEKLDWA